jgi:hypothetical protein
MIGVAEIGIETTGTSTAGAGTDGSSRPHRSELTMPEPNRPGPTGPVLGRRQSATTMDLQQPESVDRPVAASLKATYRALLARGLEAGEAANLTAFLHGLPSAGFKWTLPEVEAIVHRRLLHAAEQRATARAFRPATPPAPRIRRSTAGRRSARCGSTHVIDPPPA